jgi:hypothetical protein
MFIVINYGHNDVYGTGHYIYDLKCLIYDRNNY